MLPFQFELFFHAIGYNCIVERGRTLALTRSIRAFDVDSIDTIDWWYHTWTLQLADKLPERYKGQRKAKATKAVGNLAFPYSLYFVFYEQYAFIQVLS